VVTNSGLKLNKGLNAINVAGVTRKENDAKKSTQKTPDAEKRNRLFSGIQGQSDESVI